MTHAFISYNSKDHDLVLPIVEALKSESLSIWFDRDLRGGDDWMDEIARGLRSSENILVLVGPNGLGKWETDEYKEALQEQKERGCRVIPVLLPGFPADGRLPLGLRSKHCVDLRAGVDSRSGIDQVIFSITGVAPSAQAIESSVPVESESTEERALSRLCEYLVDDNMTFFFGSRVCQAGPEDIDPAAHVARRLLSTLIDPLDDLLIPSMDVAGSYYAINAGDTLLENTVLRILLERDAALVPICTELVRLLRLLAFRPPVRGRRRSEQLLISASPDLSIERALLHGGIPFIRIVQHRSSSKLWVNEYAQVEAVDDVVLLGGPGEAKRSILPRDLDQAIERTGRREIERGAESPLRLAEEAKDGPVLLLYKFLGSQDLKNSCALSADQHLTLMRRIHAEGGLPQKVQQILENTPMLLLGTGLLDPDFRLAYHGILRESLAMSPGMNFALRPRPRTKGSDWSSHLEAVLWERIQEGARERNNITLVDVSPQDFLKTLGDRLEPRLRR